MAGPMPPNVGGMATVLADLASSKLSDEVDLLFFNTAKTTREGRSLIEAVSSKCGLWIDWIKLLKMQPQTIAHIHTCSGFTFFLDIVLVCLARFCAIPVVLHIHGGKFNQFLDGLNSLLLCIVRWICRRCEFIIVLSESWKTELRTRLGRQRFVVVANGVPVNTSISRKFQDGHIVNVLFLGSLTENKGILDLLAVMSDVDGAVLHIVGGEEQPGMVETVTRLMKEPKLKGKVEYHGIQSGRDKQQFLQNADIFVLPSYAEGLPIALLEAMAYGIPVIVSNVGGIPSVVTDEQEGYLITAGNQKELSTALIKLIDHPELRKQLGEAAKKRCQSQFSIDVTVDKLLNLYSEIFPEFRDHCTLG